MRFYGREEELQTLSNFLQIVRKKHLSQMVVVTGRRRVGKTTLILKAFEKRKNVVWDEGTKNGPDRSALLGHNFVYQETKPHGFYSSYFHQRISS